MAWAPELNFSLCYLNFSFLSTFVTKCHGLKMASAPAHPILKHPTSSLNSLWEWWKCTATLTCKTHLCLNFLPTSLTILPHSLSLNSFPKLTILTMMFLWTLSRAPWPSQSAVRGNLIQCYDLDKATNYSSQAKSHPLSVFKIFIETHPHSFICLLSRAIFVLQQQSCVVRPSVKPKLFTSWPLTEKKIVEPVLNNHSYIDNFNSSYCTWLNGRLGSCKKQNLQMCKIKVKKSVSSQWVQSVTYKARMRLSN